MNLKWAALLIIGAAIAELSSGSETQQPNKDPKQTERSATQHTNKVPRQIDTYLKPPPPQQSHFIPPHAAPTSAPLPFMQRIARWFLSSETPAETHPKPFFAHPPSKQSYGAQKALAPPVAGPIAEACRPCNKIPWIPMFPIKGAISDAVLSLVSGQNFGGGGGHKRPKEPPFGTYGSGPSGGEQLSLPASAPQKFPSHTQAHFLTNLVPRPVHVRPPPPPPPPPPPYRIPPPAIGPGDQRQLISYLAPPYNRPSIYGHLRPYGGGQIGYVPQKEEITVTILENKNKPNGIYSIPGGPQIHLVSDFRPSGFGGTIEELKTNPSQLPPKLSQPEIIPSLSIANYLSSIEYPMVLGHTHMMDLTNEDPRKPQPADSTVHGRLPSLSGPANELPIHYNLPEKETPFIGPHPSSESKPNASHSPSLAYENAHQGGPYVTERPFPSPAPPFSSPAPPHSSPKPAYSSPALTYSSGTPLIHSSTQSPVSHSGHVDLPTVSSILTSSSGPAVDGQNGYSSTLGTLTRGVDSSTRAPIGSPSTYSPPITSSSEAPKFFNSYSPPASTYVDIQPSLQTAEYLSSLPNKDSFANNNAYHVHSGQGFRLSENYEPSSYLNQHANTGHSQENLNPKGHYITKQPPSPTPPPSANLPHNNYPQRPPPSPFQAPKHVNAHHSVPLAQNPSLWTRDHPYSFQIPPNDSSEGSINNQNQDTVSTGSGQTQVPFENHHHFIEEPPIFRFIHNANGGHSSNNHNVGAQGGTDQNKWRHSNAGPSTVRPGQTPSSRPSQFYGLPPTPFTTSTTATPAVVIPNESYSASTVVPNFSGNGYSPSPGAGNHGDESQNRNKGKRTKQVQIIIPYITGGGKSTQIDAADQSVLHSVNGAPGGKSIQDGSAIHRPNSVSSAGDSFPHWQQRYPVEEDYHDHQESRTVTASALHPNHLRKDKISDMKIEELKDTGFQHVLAANLRELLKGEVDQSVSENPLYRLQKNIDAWTAQQFSGKPIPVTSSEGLTTKSFVNLFEDHEASGSHDHRATARPDGTIISVTTPSPRTTSESTSSTFWGLHSNLVIPESVSKVNDSEVTGRLAKISDASQSIATTAANWSKTQVAISPTTKERVYVVTPMTVGTWDETTTPRTPTSSHYTTSSPSTSIDPSPSQAGVTVTSSGNPFTSPRFLVRPTPGVKIETWPSNGVFVTTTTDASVREDAADISSNDIFHRTERPRHKASEGTFAIYGPSGSPALVTVPTPSYTLLPGTEVKTFTGHSRVVTSVSSPGYSYTTSYSPSSAGKTLAAQQSELEYEAISRDSGRSTGRRMDDDTNDEADASSSPPKGSIAEIRKSFPDDYIRHFPELSEQTGSLEAEEEATVKGVVVELKREPS